MGWETPKIYVGGDNLLPNDFNTISNDLNYLYKRNRYAVSRLAAAQMVTYSVTSTTFAALQYPAIPAYRAPMYANALYIMTVAIPLVSFNVASRLCYFDIRVDTYDTVSTPYVYLSSNTATSLTEGLYSASSVASENTSVNFSVAWKPPTDGLRKLTLYARVSAASTTCTLRCDSGLTQFFVNEVASD